MKTKETVIRIIIFSILLCVLLALLFNIYADKLVPKFEAMEKEDKEPNLLWLFEHLSLALPAVAILAFFGVCYMNKEKHIPIITHNEQFIIMLVGIVFIFVVLLLRAKSTPVYDLETEEQIGTLLDSTYLWFGAQIIPTVIIAAYHKIRSGSEKKELEGGNDD